MHVDDDDMLHTAAGLTESQLPASWPLLCSDWRQKDWLESRDQ